MAIQILPQQQSAGALFGAGLGRGLSTGIESLIDMKLQDMKKQQQIRATKEGLTQILGKDKAEALAPLTVEFPQLANTLIQQELDAPGQMAYMEALTGIPQAPVAPGIPTAQPAMPSVAPMQPEVTPALEPQVEAPVLETPVIEPVAPVEPIAAPEKKPVAGEKIINKLGSDIERMRTYLPRVNKKDVPKLQAQIDKKEERLEKLIFKKKEIQDKTERFEKKQDLQEKKFKLQEKKYFSDLSVQKRKEEREDQKEIDKQSKPTYDKVLDQAKATKMNEMRLDRMKELNDKGRMGSQLINTAISTLGKGIGGKLLGNIGLNLDFLMTEDAQEFQKLSQDFLKNVKSIFGARVTQQEVQMYLKTIPTLFQSQGGRSKVINNLKQFNKIPLLRERALNRLIKENNGRLPRNLESKIEQEIAPQLNKIAKIFKSTPVKPKGWLRSIGEAATHGLISLTGL